MHTPSFTYSSPKRIYDVLISCFRWFDSNKFPFKSIVLELRSRNRSVGFRPKRCCSEEKSCYIRYVKRCSYCYRFGQTSMSGFWMTAPVIPSARGLQCAKSYHGNLGQPVVIVLDHEMLLAYFH